ncbi:MAG TPA: hypothetical protein VFO20_05275 [Propionibacteriaceae bacterium]|nr:hypothetical protein [Propionibacteriaceae bacterium]HEX5907822.1 hypothetical protein [Propionibacteriaceae bacterium]
MTVFFGERWNAPIVDHIQQRPANLARTEKSVRKLEVLIDEVGPSLRWAEANVQRVAG